MSSKGTAHRTVRVEDRLWAAAKELASERGENLSEIIREALREYVEKGAEDEWAAAEAIWLNSREIVLHKEHYRDAKSALAAADAVMFSDEAVDLAVSCVAYEITDPNVTAQRLVKLVLGALKGAGDE